MIPSGWHGAEKLATEQPPTSRWLNHPKIIALFKSVPAQSSKSVRLRSTAWVTCLGRKSYSEIMKINLRLWYWAIVALMVVQSSYRALAVDQTDVVDNYVRAEMTKQRIPGLALLVSRGGQVIRAQGYGLANVELQVPVKPETIFQSGSVGKQFTATAVMMLVEEGKIGLEDPLTKYFPDAPPSWKKVTIRELLSHTAGFTDYPKSFDMRRDYTEAEQLKIVESIPLAFAPGTSWSYSNLGFLTLGILIHKITGEFYGDFLQERIFRPLDMQTTRIISEADIVPNRSAGYRLVKGELKNQEWVSPTVNTTADGSLYFSITDLAKWDAALYTEKLLKRSSLDEMWTVAKLSNGRPNSGHYGFGWFVATKNGHWVVEHEGAWQGFETQISRYVDDKLTVVVLTNLEDARPEVLADRVAEMYLSGGRNKKLGAPPSGSSCRQAPQPSGKS
jgi:CubicO group peptidase (beta-lactamase class C family)